MALHSKARGLPVAVIDTTLLSRLVDLEVAQFLPLVFKLILIPPEVKREAYKSRGKRRLRNLVNEMSGFFVDCYEVDEFTKSFLQADLDEGEAAAIAQADYKQTVLLLDEKKGFKRAETMRLTVIRTLNVLNKLKEAEAIKEVKPYYDKLSRTGFYVKESVRLRLLAEAGEE
jgi:predicted nucleic acid-binding protein